MTGLPCTPDPSLAPERMWTSLVDAAIAMSRCEGSGPQCNIQLVFHRAGWAVVRHVSAEPHRCTTCPRGPIAEHLISAYTLIHTERRVLTQMLAAWLGHFHETQDPTPDNSDATSGAGLGRGTGTAASDRCDASRDGVAAVHGIPDLVAD